MRTDDRLALARKVRLAATLLVDASDMALACQMTQLSGQFLDVGLDLFHAHAELIKLHAKPVKLRTHPQEPRQSA